MVASESSELNGRPGAIGSDRDGLVVSVDNEKVVALDAHGGERWSAPVPGAGLGWPLLGDGLVVVPTFREEEGGPGGCVALDRVTGEHVWLYEERDSHGVAVARSGSNVICVLGNAVIVAIDRITGARRWRSVLFPLARRDQVSIADRTGVVIDKKTGLLVLTMSVVGSPILATIDLETGAPGDHFNLAEFERVGAPVSTGPGRIAVGAKTALCMFDLERWRLDRCVQLEARNGFDAASIPVVSDSVLVIAGLDGTVSAVDLQRHKVRWAVTTPNPILSARPVVVNGVVVLCDWSREIQALRLSDGSQVKVPVVDGWALTLAGDTHGGFAVTKRNMDDSWIERWTPVH